MKRSVSIALLFMALVSSQLQAQTSEEAIPRNSKVFINDMQGFETYLIAALKKKEVPLLIVANKEQADFEIKGSATTKKAGTAKIIFGTGRSEEDASVQIINIKTGVVVYGSSSHKHDSWHGKKSTAEAIAKSIRAKMEDDEKAMNKKK
jgi:hypothetical protein